MRNFSTYSLAAPVEEDKHLHSEIMGSRSKRLATGLHTNILSSPPTAVGLAGPRDNANAHSSQKMFPCLIP